MLALVALFLVLSNANLAGAAWPSAFSNVSNFYYVMNFTSIAHNATFYGKNIGPVNYVYIPLTNLTSITSSGWLLRGYNGSVFIGNVSGYQYQQGLLVSLSAINGKAYDTLALFWKQGVSLSTPSMSDQRYNVTVDINAIKYPFVQYLLGLHRSGQLPSQNTFNNVSFLGCTYQNNQTCSWSFRPMQPYFFIETATYSQQNVSVDYINVGGVQEAVLWASSTTAFIKGRGFPGSGTLTQPITTPLTMLIKGSVSNPSRAFQYGENQSYLASNGIGWKTNETNYGIYNSTSGPVSPGWLYTGINNKAVITIYTNNAPYENTAFYLVPAYTEQYVNTTPFYNSTPTIYNNITGNCFQYRVPIANFTFSYNFTTMAFPGHQGNGYTINFTSSKVPYLKLTLPHKNEMNVTCGDIYLADPLDGGQIPYARLQCNASKVELIARNISLTGHTYNSIYVYYASGIKGADFSNSSVMSSWKLGNGKTFNVSYSEAPFVVSLSSYLNIGSRLIVEQDIPAFSLIAFGYAGKDYLSGYGGSDLINDTSGRNTRFLVTNGITPSTYGFPSVFGNGLGAVCDNASCKLYNTSSSTTPIYSGSYVGNFTVNLTSLLRANATKLFGSWNFGAHGWPNELAPHNGSNCALPQGSLPNNATVIINASTNGTVINPGGISNSTLWGNSSHVHLMLAGVVVFYDLSIPASSAMLLALLEVVCIALSFASNDEWLVIFSLVAANFIGLTLMLGVSNVGVGFLLVSLFAAGYYVIKNAHKWWH